MQRREATKALLPGRNFACPCVPSACRSQSQSNKAAPPTPEVLSSRRNSCMCVSLHSAEGKVSTAVRSHHGKCASGRVWLRDCGSGGSWRGRRRRSPLLSSLSLSLTHRPLPRHPTVRDCSPTPACIAFAVRVLCGPGVCRLFSFRYRRAGLPGVPVCTTDKGNATHHQSSEREVWSRWKGNETWKVAKAQTAVLQEEAHGLQTEQCFGHSHPKRCHAVPPPPCSLPRAGEGSPLVQCTSGQWMASRLLSTGKQSAKWGKASVSCVGK